MKRGTSLIDLMISMAIIALLFGGIYLVYFSVITSVANISVRSAASSAISAEIETIRNLPYASVGIVNGIPSGVIPPVQSVTIGQYTFSLATAILNIEDPFDEVLEGDPSGTAPDADYKLVTVAATCPLCGTPVSVSVTTTVAPKGTENANPQGSLFLYAVDANGNPVSGATMQVVNASVTPSINLTDTTNASGVLELIGVPTSTQGYQIFASKPGYSSAQTYPPGAPSNLNPVQPNATVLAGTVTPVTLAIDQTSTLTVDTSDNLCSPLPNERFTMNGEKIIGTNPDVPKFSATSSTNASGSVMFSSLEWDTYSFALNDAQRDLAGTIPLSPLVVNPGTTEDMRLILVPAADPSLLVGVTDAATQAGISGASVTVTSGAYSKALTTGHAFVSQSDWSGGKFSSQSGGVDTSMSGELTLLLNASGTYNTGTNDWLVSNTFDLGGSDAALYTLTFSPSSQPSGASVEFQVAANNDNATWNFAGPDGTGASFFTASGASLPASLNGKRYLRYEVFLNTTDENTAPVLNSVTFEFSGDCVPPAQSLFTNIPTGTSTVDVTAPDYFETSTTVPVAAGWQSATISLTHQ